MFANRTDSKVAPVAYWQYNLGFVLYFLLISLVPWDKVFHWRIYQILMNFMSGLVPSIDVLAHKLTFAGPEYIKAELTFIHFSGVILLILNVVFTRAAPNPRKLSNGKLLWGVLWGFALVIAMIGFLSYWPGTFNKSIKEGFHDTEIRMLLVYCVYWYGVIGITALSVALLLAMFKK